ncbi:hypothetical protein J5N97_000352 [Dioscorea zingiberensis]|uniref:SKI-interacting protein SKIP SNW domain-containing protein n=1 Tax=Dioscorea zingiberensis TaxID=325984 RepID=A0A9D5H1P4_9LILI|nr:hypothetical protein J5N97_000352 [Dioscorea zingiberensis]
MDEKDVKGFITREEFERISAPILERVKAPLEKALAVAGLTVENIHSVEVVGSGSRVPAIIRILTEFFGKEPRRTLNASECVARGCALECAIISPTFKVREFQVHDGFPYSIALSWKGSAPDSDNGATDNQQNTIGPIQSTKGERAKIKVKVRLNIHGIVSVESATMEEEIEIPVSSAKESHKESIKMDTDETSNNDSAAENDVNMQDAKTDFNGSCVGTENGTSAPEDKPVQMDADAKLHDKYQEFVTGPEKEAFAAKLQEVEDWLYEDGEDETKGVYIAKLEELKKQGDPIEERYKENIERGPVSDQLVHCINSYRDAALSKDPKFDHIDVAEKQKVFNECTAVEAWLRDKKQQQDALPKYAQPALLSADLRRKAEALDSPNIKRKTVSYLLGDSRLQTLTLLLDRDLISDARGGGVNLISRLVGEDPWFKERFSSSSSSSESQHSAVIKPNPVPPYGKRSGFVLRRLEDFGDGGAFPEIHVAQYPLGMGRKPEKPGSKILPLTVDSQGKVSFDPIVRQYENAYKIVYSQHKDLVPKVVSEDDQQAEEMEKEIEETTARTKAALEKIVNVRLSAAQPKHVPTQYSDFKFVKYKPFNPGAKERIILMAEMRDPLEPPKFKHKRVPKASGSPPVPVIHSPPRPVTLKDQQDWKIPPCISDWKNPKGYTIPLDKRLAADGRGLQDVQINDNFAKLAEASYVAEQKAREAVAMRCKVHKEMLQKEKNRKEHELRALAQKARSERTRIALAPAGPAPTPSREKRKETREEREQHEKIREERRRERERERRLEAKDAAMGKKSKITRDRDRDISEKVALGMANTGAGRAGEVMYDQRLFNQEKGMESGFADDDMYNIYDKGLFTTQPTLSTLYHPKKDADSDTYGGADEQLEKVLKMERFKPYKAFTGASDRPNKRDRPVEFDKEEKESDPFGLDQFFTEVKRGKRALDKIGGGGTMNFK